MQHSTWPWQSTPAPMPMVAMVGELAGDLGGQCGAPFPSRQGRSGLFGARASAFSTAAPASLFALDPVASQLMHRLG